MPPPFIILAQSHSPTAWLSHYLSYGPWHCGHEEARHLRAVEDAQATLNMPFTGFVETTVAPFWRTLIKLRPDVKIVTIRHPNDETIAVRRKLDQIKARVPGVMEVNFHDLTDEGVCARIFEHCLELPHNSARWRALSTVNIQCDGAHLEAYVSQHHLRMKQFAAKVKQLTLIDFDRRQTFREGAELNFKEETNYDNWLSRAQSTIAKHAVTAGFNADHVTDFDHDLMRSEMKHGRLKIISCGSNGQMHGYLITSVGQAFAHKGKFIAEHTAFYASAQVPGVGRKLVKAANEALRHHGVDFVKYRAGVNADGSRLGKLYTRMGAQPIGEAFFQTL